MSQKQSCYHTANRFILCPLSLVVVGHHVCCLFVVIHACRQIDYSETLSLYPKSSIAAKLQMPNTNHQIDSSESPSLYPKSSIVVTLQAPCTTRQLILLRAHPCILD